MPHIYGALDGVLGLVALMRPRHSENVCQSGQASADASLKFISPGLLSATDNMADPIVSSAPIIG